MIHSLVVAAILASQPSTVAAGSPEPTPPTAPRSAADTVVAAAFKDVVGTSATELKKVAQSESFGSPWGIVGLAALGLAGLIFAFQRRKTHVNRGGIQILESVAVGPKRSIVIAEVMGDQLVLGFSEAGISVLLSKPAPADVITAEPFMIPQTTVERASPEMTFFDRVRGKVPTANSFEALLGESVEDQELRAKLSVGMRGVIP